MGDDEQVDQGWAATSTAPTVVSITLGDLAREAVAQAAPDQLGLFAGADARWRAGHTPGLRRRNWWGGSIGSGITSVLTGEIVYPVLSGALAQALGTVALVHGRRRWRRHRHPKSATALPTVQVTIDVGDLSVIRDACVTHGTTLGLNRAEAVLLADAVYGALRRAADEALATPPSTPGDPTE